MRKSLREHKNNYLLVAFILMVLTGNPILLLLAFFLTGINRGAISNFNNGIINEIATGKAWALNLLHSLFAIGAFISPFIALFFTRNNPNGWIYASLTIAFLCLIELIAYGMMPIPNNSPITKEHKKTDWGFLKNKYFLTACGVLFSYMCAEQAVNGWLVTYFKDSGIMSANLAQSMASLLWLVILFGRLICAYLSNKISKSKLLLMNAFGYLIFFVILLLSRTMTPVIVGIIGVGFFMAGLFPTMLASIGKILKEYPIALSFLLTFTGIGAILMPAIIGAVAESVGIIGGMSVVIIAVVITLALIIYNAIIYRNVNEL
ncbi:MAG: MFS transporter [Clostridiales bacterium]|nr:MFS transporter [Clostridiales bacterium]